MEGHTRSVRSILSIGALAVLCIAGSVHASSAHAACPPFEVLGARGSGQDKTEAERRRDENMGPEIHSFYGSLRTLLGSGAVKGYGVQYPAVDALSRAGAAAAIHLGGAYTDSVREGAADVKQRIGIRRASGCGATKFILAGYSQGAQVMGDVLRDPGIRKSVAAVALFGDPYFNGDSQSARGDYDPSLYGVFGPRPEWPADLNGHVFSYCHLHDWICNESERHHILGTDVDVYVRSTAGRPGPHKTYVSQGDTGMAAREVARAIGYTPSPIPYSGPLDIAFVIDSTGSMADEIEEVKENVTALAGQIAAIDSDYRLALVEYKDEEAEESEFQARLDLAFSNDVSAFDLALSKLEATGGGDYAESVYSGLMTALGLDWRAGAKKIVVQIGDAPAKDPEPLTGFTLRAVQSKALSVDPATVDTIQSGEEEEASSSFSAIAAATGGQYVQLPESGLSGLVPAISSEVRRNTTAPAATLTAPSQAVAGTPVTFSAGASHDVGEAIAGYDWDFDGDGVFDASTAAPVASHVYLAPFVGTAVVKVRSMSGLSSLATAPIAVIGATARRPAKPKHLRGSRHGTNLTLQWRAGKGALPQWFTVFDSKGHPIARIVPAGADRKFEVVIHNIVPRRRYRFSIAAGSEGGESRPAGPVVVGGRRPHGSGHRQQHHG